MLKTTYKYNPADFESISGLSNELEEFYRLYEIQKASGDRGDWFDFREQWENLFFSIKHRELDGVITENAACELREYLEDLLYDD